MAKMMRVRIRMAHPSGGVQYKPTNAAPGTVPTILEHGKTYEVEETFGRILVKQGRAVLDEGQEMPPDRPLTSDVLSRDPGVESAPAPKTRTR